MKLIDQVKFVVAAQCLDFATTLNNATYLLGNAISMKNWGHLTVVITGGSSGGVTGAVTLRQAATAAGVVVGATIVPIKYVWINTQTSAESDTWVKTDVVANSITSIASAHYLNYVIELDAQALTYEWVGLNIVANGGAKYMSALYILSEPRYISAEDAPTAIV